MHQIMVLGRATKDAEELKTKKKKSFVKLSIAVNDYDHTKKEETPYFYDVLIFGKSAESAIKNIKKGDMMFVMGKPEAEAYISKKDNEAKASVTVLADSWQVLK